MAKPERIRLLTPMFRVSYPDVFVKRVFQGHGEESGRYSCAALFSRFEVKDGRTIIKAPASWSDKDQAKWSALVAACNKVSIEAFKKPMNDLDRGVYKLPFHRCEEKEYDGCGLGVVYFTMSAKNRRPGIVAKDGITPITQGGDDEFYAGCYARASVTPFANVQWSLCRSA
jgi:Enterobacter phage Enc34, ssDNA-binding protein